MNKLPDFYYYLFSVMAEKLAVNGVKYAVLCPGSRSAPIALTLMRNSKIKTFVVNDERSAAYIALGIANYSASPVVLLSTSGTAALNFSPAVAEAFNQNISLLVFTADRPSHFKDIGENQTIRQENLFEPNVTASYQLIPENYINRFDEFHSFFLNFFTKAASGPVHINCPLNDPLYSEQLAEYEIDNQEAINQERESISFNEDIFNQLKQINRILIIPGLFKKNIVLEKTISQWCNKYKAVVLHDITSNIHQSHNLIKRPDYCLQQNEAAQLLKPDLIISFGNYTVSKNVKEFLRKHSPSEHWHIDKFGRPTNTYFCLSKTITAEPYDFFHATLNNDDGFQSESDYPDGWMSVDEQLINLFQSKLNTNKELNFIDQFIQKIPENSILHLGNSMVVRYANEACVPDNKNIEIFSNRGTSGIDGSLSTALGVALVSGKPNFILLGDQSFVYDRNALWNNFIPENLKIIVINNRGGNIFRLMKGPSAQPEMEEYFVNYVAVEISKIVEAHSIPYFMLNRTDDFSDFIAYKGCCIGEFEL